MVVVAKLSPVGADDVVPKLSPVEGWVVVVPKAWAVLVAPKLRP